MQEAESVIRINVKTRKNKTDMMIHCYDNNIYYMTCKDDFKPDVTPPHQNADRGLSVSRVSLIEEIKKLPRDCRSSGHVDSCSVFCSKHHPNVKSFMRNPSGISSLKSVFLQEDDTE